MSTNNTSSAATYHSTNQSDYPMYFPGTWPISRTDPADITIMDRVNRTSEKHPDVHYSTYAIKTTETANNKWAKSPAIQLPKVSVNGIRYDEKTKKLTMPIKLDWNDPEQKAILDWSFAMENAIAQAAESQPIGKKIKTRQSNKLPPFHSHITYFPKSEDADPNDEDAERDYRKNGIIFATIMDIPATSKYPGKQASFIGPGNTPVDYTTLKHNHFECYPVLNFYDIFQGTGKIVLRYNVKMAYVTDISDKISYDGLKVDDDATEDQKSEFERKLEIQSQKASQIQEEEQDKKDTLPDNSSTTTASNQMPPQAPVATAGPPSSTQQPTDYFGQVAAPPGGQHNY